MAKESVLRDTVLEHAIAEAERLVDFLNTAASASESFQVMEIFRSCQGLSGLKKEDDAEKFERQASALLRTVNSRLQQFPIVPTLSGRNPYFVFWRMALDQRSPRGEVRPLSGKELAERPAPLFHVDVIRVVLEMTEAGTLGRIRQCVCGKWFFAQTNKKQACSDACRSQKYRQANPITFKDEHKEYMRNYRKVKADLKNGKTKTR